MYHYDEASQQVLLYPRCKFQHRLNPYRLHMLARTHTARTIKKVLALRDTNHLDDFRMTKIVLTVPQELSKWLAKQSGGVLMMWRLYNRFWADCLLKLDDQSSGQAALVWLHTWKSKTPLEHHSHFHICLPNYREVPAFDDPEHGQTYELVKRPWHLNNTGTPVPFDDDQREAIQASWTQYVANFCKRHRIKCQAFQEGRMLDIYIQYICLDDPDGTQKLIHTINYNGRHPLEDYALYSNDHPDCAYPSQHLQTYTNKARAFGYWKHLKALIGKVDDSDISKLSPLTGKPMQYVGRVTLSQLLERTGGQLGSLDFVNGKLVPGDLTKEDIDRLKSVDYNAPGNAGYVEGSHGWWDTDYSNRSPP